MELSFLVEVSFGENVNAVERSGTQEWRVPLPCPDSACAYADLDSGGDEDAKKAISCHATRLILKEAGKLEHGNENDSKGKRACRHIAIERETIESGRLKPVKKRTYGTMNYQAWIEWTVTLCTPCMLKAL